jgi:C4-dicarboxylate-specific signal transduction histidine kinase
MRNLVANALDSVAAKPAGERRIKVSAQDFVPVEKGKAGQQHLRITVEDSGSGVSAALAARLFEPFVSSKASGLGLGLVLSRAIVEAHGGDLWAEVADYGIFRFILPALETD